MGPSGTTDQTHVPCIGRRILNHCATREALQVYFLLYQETFLCGDWEKTLHIEGSIKNEDRDFPGGPVVKNLPSNAGDMG